MKKPMKKTMGKRTRRFGAGGETNPDENAAGSQVKFSEAQEKFLGGADRTDPFILARMRKAVPDEAKTEVAPAKTEAAAEPAKPAKMEPEFVTVSSDSPNLGTSKVETSSIKPRLPQTAKRRDESKAEAKTESKGESKGEPKVDGKTFTETIAPAKVKPSDAKTENKPSKSAAEEDFDEKVRKLRLENVNKPYPKEKSFFEDLKDRFGGKRVEGVTPRMAKGGSVKKMAKGGSVKKMAKGGSVKKMTGGGKVKSASARADGCAIRGKTRA